MSEPRIDAGEPAPAAPLSDLDRKILETLGAKIGLDMNRPSPWTPTVARSVTWIANRSGISATSVLGRLMDLAARDLVVIMEEGRAHFWRLTPAGCDALGAATAPPAPEEPDLTAATGPELIEIVARWVGVNRYPPGPLRSAAAVGAAIARGLSDEVVAACSAVAVEQMEAALEGSAGRVEYGPSGELLAARQASARLAAALKAARRAMVREVRELRHHDAGKREYDSAHRLELAREAVDAVLLPAPSLAGEG